MSIGNVKYLTSPTDISRKPMSRMRITRFQSKGIEYLWTAIPFNPARSGGALSAIVFLT